MKLLYSSIYLINDSNSHFNESPETVGQEFNILYDSAKLDTVIHETRSRAKIINEF